jgi:hypothetical protein
MVAAGDDKQRQNPAAKSKTVFENATIEVMAKFIATAA